MHENGGIPINYIIHYDVAAFVITFAITLHFFYKKSIDTYQTKLFSLLIVLELGSSALDLVTIYTIGHPQAVSKFWHYILNEVYLLSFNATSAVYFAYIVNAVKKKRKIKPLERALMRIPFCVDTLLMITTPVTGLIFTISETNEYEHGALFFIYQRDTWHRERKQDFKAVCGGAHCSGGKEKSILFIR